MENEQSDEYKKMMEETMKSLQKELVVQGRI